MHYESRRRDPKLAACDRTPLVLVNDKPFDIVASCDVLRAWDGRYNLDSVGAPLWREFLASFKSADRADKGALYRNPFDPTDPVATPNQAITDDVALLTNLGIAADAMIAAGFPIDSALGDLQYDGRPTAERIPLPGGSNVDGAASIVSCCSNPNTLGPKGDPGTFSDNHEFSDKGYPVTNGDSFMMTVEFLPAGPHAEAILTYGQPDDATSPNFIAQTRLFAAGQFRPVLFTDAAIAADPDKTTVTVTGPR